MARPTKTWSWSVSTSCSKPLEKGVDIVLTPGTRLCRPAASIGNSVRSRSTIAGGALRSARSRPGPGAAGRARAGSQQDPVAARDLVDRPSGRPRSCSTTSTLSSSSGRSIRPRNRISLARVAWPGSTSRWRSRSPPLSGPGPASRTRGPSRARRTPPAPPAGSPGSRVAASRMAASWHGLRARQAQSSHPGRRRPRRIRSWQGRDPALPLRLRTRTSSGSSRRDQQTRHGCRRLRLRWASPARRWPRTCASSSSPTARPPTRSGRWSRTASTRRPRTSA